MMRNMKAVIGLIEETSNFYKKNIFLDRGYTIEHGKAVVEKDENGEMFVLLPDVQIIKVRDEDFARRRIVSWAKANRVRMPEVEWRGGLKSPV